MAITKTEQIVRGLQAGGWTQYESKSSRECWTKEVLSVRGESRQMWLWLGGNGTVRANTQPKFTTARAMSDKFILAIINTIAPKEQS